jgi:hypothetical protein
MGVPVAELIRPSGVPEQTFYRWKKRWAGSGPGASAAPGGGGERAAEAISGGADFG